MQEIIGSSGVRALPVAVAEEQSVHYFLCHILSSPNVLRYGLKFGTELSVTKTNEILGEKKIGGLEEGQNFNLMNNTSK